MALKLVYIPNSQQQMIHNTHFIGLVLQIKFWFFSQLVLDKQKAENLAKQGARMMIYYDQQELFILPNSWKEWTNKSAWMGITISGGKLQSYQTSLSLKFIELKKHMIRSAHESNCGTIM